MGNIMEDYPMDSARVNEQYLDILKNKYQSGKDSYAKAKENYENANKYYTNIYEQSIAENGSTNSCSIDEAKNNMIEAKKALFTADCQDDINNQSYFNALIRKMGYLSA